VFHICDVAEMVVIHNTILAKFRDKQDNIKVKRLRFLHIFGYMLEPNRGIWQHFTKKEL
jgi:hypothetical protein